MFLVSYCNSYWQFFTAGLGFGFTGTGFAIGIAYTSVWFPKHKQGLALGIFGAGNAGAALTSLGAPHALNWLTDNEQIQLEASGTWQITASWDGDDNYESVTKTLTVDVSAEVGKAIIVLGGGNADSNSQWKTFSSVASHVYKVLLQRQFDDEIGRAHV